jgi:hypothetical protein
VVFDGIGEKVFLVYVVFVDGTFDFTMLYHCAMQLITAKHFVPFDFIL